MENLLKRINKLFNSLLFDPLAICLLLAYNTTLNFTDIVGKPKDDIKIYQHQDSVDEPSENIESVVEQAKKDLQKNEQLLHDYMKRIVRELRNEYNLTINKLELINPLSLMKKGYSVTRHNGVIIKSITNVKQGDTLSVSLQDGKIDTVVQAIRKGE